MRTPLQLPHNIRDQLFSIIDVSPIGITVADRDGRIVFANHYAEQVLCLKVSAITDRTYDDPSWRITDFDGNEILPADLPFAVVRTTGRSVEDIRHAIRRDDGGRVLLSVSASPIFDYNGEFGGMVAAIRDITDQVSSEKALKESVAMLRSVFRAAPVGIGVVKNRVLVWTNERITEISGYSEEELRNKNARMLYPSDEDYQYVGEEKYQQIKAHGTGTVETRWRRKDGRIIDVLLSSTPIDLDDLEKGVTFSAMDITERRGLEERLRQSEKLEVVGMLAGGIAGSSRESFEARSRHR